MLDKIKQAVFQNYKKTDNTWIFLSAISDKGELLISSGTLYSDKELENLIETLYHWLIEKYKNIAHIIIDIVTYTEKVTNPLKIKNISLQEFWLALVTENKSWILLPNTTGIEDIGSALKIIKEKNWLEWNTNIIKFQTDRFSV